MDKGWGYMKTAGEWARAALDEVEAEAAAIVFYYNDPDGAKVFSALEKLFQEAMAQHVGQEYATTWDDPV
jgi:hypothetical protein